MQLQTSMKCQQRKTTVVSSSSSSSSMSPASSCVSPTPLGIRQRVFVPPANKSSSFLSSVFFGKAYTMVMEMGQHSGALHTLFKLAILVSATLVMTELLQSRSDLRRLRRMEYYPPEPCPCATTTSANVAAAVPYAASSHGKDNRAMLLQNEEVPHSEPVYENGIEARHSVLEDEDKSTSTSMSDSSSINKSDSRSDSSNNENNSNSDDKSNSDNKTNDSNGNENETETRENNEKDANDSEKGMTIEEKKDDTIRVDSKEDNNDNNDKDNNNDNDKDNNDTDNDNDQDNNDNDNSKDKDNSDSDNSIDKDNNSDNTSDDDNKKESEKNEMLLDENFPCNILTFRRFYSQQWESMAGVPFTLPCLDKLITENPTVLSLRAALVRKKYASSVRRSDRKLIYHCAEGSGGLGDRLWGSAFGLYLSMALNARFGVFFEEPVHYDSYLEAAGDDLPHMKNILHSMGTDWLKEYLASPKNPTFTLEGALDKLESANQTSTVQVIRSTRETYTAPEFASMPLGHHFFPEQVELTFFQMKQPPIIMLNTTAALYDNPMIQSMRREYRLEDMSPQQWLSIYVMLYAKKPTSFLQELERPLLEEINGRYVVGLQIRIGATTSGAIQWQDPQRYENVDPINCFIKGAMETCNREMDRQQEEEEEGSSPPGCVLLVTSDSTEAIQRIQKAFRNTRIDVLEAGGREGGEQHPITHIDKVLEEDKKIHEDQRLVHSRAFSDWHMLAFRTDRLLISRSGFGEVAAMARPERPVLRLRDDGEDCRFASFVHCRYGTGDAQQVTPGFSPDTHTVRHKSVVGLSLGPPQFTASA